MSIAARYGELFQMSYITRDLDAAMEHARATLGITNFSAGEPVEVEVLSYGERRPLKVRAAMANIGRHQFEIVQPISGAIEIYTDEVDLSGHIVNYHHIAIAVRGPYAEWERLLAEVREEIRAFGQRMSALGIKATSP